MVFPTNSKNILDQYFNWDFQQTYQSIEGGKKKKGNSTTSSKEEKWKPNK